MSSIKSRATECRDNPAIINQDTVINISEAVCSRLAWEEALKKGKHGPYKVINDPHKVFDVIQPQQQKSSAWQGFSSC